MAKRLRSPNDAPSRVARYFALLALAALPCSACRKEPVQESSPLARPAPIVPFSDREPSRKLNQTAVLPGHWSAIGAIAYTLDGTSVLSGSNDRSVKLWDVRTGNAVRSFAGHTDRVSAVVVTPDGKTLVTAGDTTVRLWNPFTGDPIRTLTGHTGPVLGLSVSRDGKVAASGSADGTVRVWNLEDGKPLQTIAVGKKVSAVALSPDGKTVISSGEDGAIRVWEALSAKSQSTVEAHKAPVNAVLLTDDGQTIVSGSDDATVKVWSLRTGQLFRTLSGHSAAILAMALTPDGRLLASTSKDGEIRLWSLNSGGLLAKANGDRSGVMAVALARGGSQMATGGGDQAVRVWEIEQQLPPSWHAPRVLAPLPASSARTASPREDENLYREAKALIDHPGEKSDKLLKAQDLLGRALRLHADNPLVLVELGRAAYKLGYVRPDEYTPESLTKALELCEGALAASPDLPEALVCKGYVYAYQGDPEAAHKMAERADKLRPSDPDTEVLFMSLAKHENDADAVITHARKIIEPAKDARAVTIAYQSLQWAYQQRREWQAAEDAYLSLIQLEPNSAWVKGSYLSYLVSRAEYDRAIEFAKTAQLKDPLARQTLANAYASKGEQLLLRKGEEDQAKQLFDLALQQDPRNAKALYAIGLYYRDRGDRANAEKWWKRAVEANPKNDSAQKALTQLQSAPVAP